MQAERLGPLMLHIDIGAHEEAAVLELIVSLLPE